MPVRLSPAARLPRLLLLLVLLAGAPGWDVVAPALAQQQPATAETAFADAYRLHVGRLYEPAEQAFADFLRAYPHHPSAPDALYYQAEALLALGRADDAVALLQRFQRRYPRHPRAIQAQLALGKHYYDAGQYALARQAFERLVASGPPAEEAAKALYWTAEAALREGRTEEALAAYRQAADQYRGASVAPQALYALAFTLRERQRYDEAAQAFEVLAARYPRSPYARTIGLALAEIYYELDDYTRTVTEVKLRLPEMEGAPRERALFLLAEAYNQLRDGPNAISFYRQLIEAYPQGPYVRPAYYGLGWNYYLEQSYQQAADHFQRAIGGADDDLAARATYYAAVNRSLAEDPEAALDLYQRYLEVWPSGALADHALFELGTLYYQEQFWEEANDAFSRFTTRFEASDLYPESLRLLGYTEIALGRVNEALAAFDRAIALNAAPAELRDEVLFQKAWLLYRSGNYREAAPTFLRLHESAPRGNRGDEALFWAAESFFQLANYGRAQELFTRYLRDFPRGTKVEAAHYALGWTYFKQNRYAQASQSFEQFLRLAREDQGSLPYRTDARLRLADSYYALRRYGEARRLYGEVAETGADYALYQTAQAYAQGGDETAAISTYRRLLERYPESAFREEAQYGIGYLYFQLQDYARAIEAYRVVIERYPRDPLAARAQYGIGDAYFNDERLEEAVAAYQAVLERYPESPVAADAATSIVFALNAQGEEGRAAEVIERFAQNNPASPANDALRFRLAEAQFQSGRTAEALQSFLAFLEAARDDRLEAEAHYYVGLIYADRGDADAAERYLRPLATTEAPRPRRAEAAERLGRLYLDQGRFNEALQTFERLEALAPDDGRRAALARYGQSMALLGLGRAAEAERLLQQSIDAAPEAPEADAARLGLARLYEQTGRLREALAAYRAVVARNAYETGAEALFRLGDLLLREGRPQEALDALGTLATTYAGFDEWVAQGFLVQARAHRRLDQPDEARRLYDLVMDSFPDTPYAETARQEKAAL